MTDTRARFYERLATAVRPAGFSAEEELDVLERCRLLRNLPRPRALQMLRAMASVLAEELETFDAQAVLSHMVDDYATHLLAELARRRGIVYAGFAYSYFPGKVQVTAFGNGAPLDAREPTDDEVSEVLQQISERTFRQNYLQKDSYTRLRHVKAMLRYRVKQVVFKAMARWHRDPLHMHYACLPYVVERRRWRDFPASGDFHVDWRSQLEQARSGAGRAIVYFPLGYFPEATIDYWIEDRRILRYEEVVLEICRTLAPQVTLVVKEHLHMLGARDTAFYRAMRDIPGVISVPPLEFSNDVLAAADVVLMGGGSIGVEAYIRGKAVASFCDSSYWFAHADAAPLDLARIGDWPHAIRRKIQTHAEPTPSERVAFIRQCLRSTMRQQRPGAVWPICEPDDLSALLATAAAGKSKGTTAFAAPTSADGAGPAARSDRHAA